MQFQYHDQLITLQGIVVAEQGVLQELHAEQLVKWLDDNEVWALAVVENFSTVDKQQSPLAPDLQALLTKFSDVFSEPNFVPPRRSLDHAITLQQDAQPVNSRPYRYSPLQKDEIERQVMEMLQAGVIIPSMSPFTSPVLLVKKKDNTWRFCIDYRCLNDLTVKNKFPLPIVDELLDELAGTQFFSKLDLRAGYHQIRMRPADEAKTTFKTHHGHF